MDTEQGDRTHSGIDVITLGCSVVQAAIDDHVRQIFGPGKTHALLAYLACSPGRKASRDHLVDLLWSDRELKPVRHALVGPVRSR